MTDEAAAALRYLISVSTGAEPLDWGRVVDAILVLLRWINAQFHDTGVLIGDAPESLDKASTVDLLKQLDGANEGYAEISPAILIVIFERLVNWLLELWKEKREG